MDLNKQFEEALIELATINIKAFGVKGIVDLKTVMNIPLDENITDEEKQEIVDRVIGYRLLAAGSGGMVEVEEQDIINKPDHYHKGGMDIYEIMQAKFSREYYEGFCMGNILKYNMRFELKGGVQDLEKAQFNQDRLIESQKGIKYVPKHKRTEGIQ